MKSDDSDLLQTIRKRIRADVENAAYTQQGLEPLFWATPTSRIILISQAPGALAQAKNLAWRDQSGKVLRSWLGLSEEEFYDPAITAVVPMDFYFPGYLNNVKKGDAPPRKDFAAKWHPEIFDIFPKDNLKILIGSYAQKYYLSTRSYPTLTENVRNYTTFLPEFFPLPHPSGRNGPWLIKNPWFKAEVVPKLQELVRSHIS